MPPAALYVSCHSSLAPQNGGKGRRGGISHPLPPCEQHGGAAMPLSLPVPSFPCATGRESPVPGGATALPPAPGAGGKVPDLIEQPCHSHPRPPPAGESPWAVRQVRLVARDSPGNKGMAAPASRPWAPLQNEGGIAEVLPLHLVPHPERFSSCEPKKAGKTPPSSSAAYT